MNTVVVATDVPAFLMNVILNYPYYKLGIIKRGALHLSLNARVAGLPKKVLDFDAQECMSYFDQDLVDIINEIDFSKMTRRQLDSFEVEIQNAIKE